MEQHGLIIHQLQTSATHMTAAPRVAMGELAVDV